MRKERANKLQLLVRRNRGRTEYQYYATELSHLLRAEVLTNDILDLEQTDRIFSAHRAQSVRTNKEAGFAIRKRWNYKPIDPWLCACRYLGKKLQGEASVLFVGPYEFCGAVKVDADRALGAAAPLLEFDRDTVGLQSATMESGLYLDLFEEDSERLVELVVWGQWKTLAADSVISESE